MLGVERGGAGTAFTGARATYVALCAVSTLALALLASVWVSDVSGACALLGLLAIYLASSELLVLYSIFSPASVLVDLIRLSAATGVRGRGWLILFTLLESCAKIAGAVFAWSLYKSIGSGDGSYQPASQQPMASSVPPVPGTSNMSTYHPQGPETTFVPYAPPRTADPFMMNNRGAGMDPIHLQPPHHEQQYQQHQQQQEQQQHQIYMPFPTSQAAHI